MTVWDTLPFKIAMAFVLDLCLGDPRWLPHPVVIMGRAASRIETILRRFASTPGALRLVGGITTLVVVAGSYLVTLLLITVAGKLSTVAEIALEVFFLHFTLAIRGLHDHVMAVYKALVSNNLAAARQAVGMIVGRDTAGLSETEISRAAVESAAENASDGIIAPLFYGFLGGAPLAMAYKAVNTLDSMFGHKDERYLYFGLVSARLDDLANFLPARLTAFFLALAGYLRGHSWRRALTAVRRDARKHPSPNSGYPESCMAGLLGIRLGGLNYYGGIPSFRDYLEEGGERPQLAHIREAASVVRLAAWLTLAGVILILLTGRIY